MNVLREKILNRCHRDYSPIVGNITTKAYASVVWAHMSMDLVSLFECVEEITAEKTRPYEQQRDKD